MFTHRLQRERREAAISASLITRLKEAVQGVLQPGGGGGALDPRSPPSLSMLGRTDNMNNLCNVIEAVLIHGLRDSLGERMSALLGADPDRMPVPNFWPVIMTISHRDLMEQVGKLSFISSEVGRSRAWLRLALNQGQLCSYLSVLLHDTRTLKDYYRQTALVRDLERGDIVLRVLQPIAALTFTLPTNAAVLNTWTQTPLVLAGLWAPSVQNVVSDPVLAGTDVASTVMDERSHAINIPIVETPVSDQMFDMIFGGTPETSFISDMEKRKNEEKGDNKDITPTKDTEKKGPKHIPSVTIENPVFGDEEKEIITESQGSKGPQHTTEPTKDTLQTPTSEDHLPTEGQYSRTYSVESGMSTSIIEADPEYDQLFSDLGEASPFPSVPGPFTSPAHHAAPDQESSSAGTSASTSTKVSRESSRSDEAEKLNYEVLSTQKPSDEETNRLMPLLTRLCTEEGLDAQQYQCHECQAYIGMIYGKPRVCSYDGKYYCYECHEDEVSLIPARVVHNWDLSGHPVCRTNARWLANTIDAPLINLRTVNPRLYYHIDDLAEMQMLRTQLLYIRAYLFTCRSGVGEELRKVVWPREHLYEHVHLYSLSDLQLVSTGQLVARVRQAVTLGRDHVGKCQVCTARGFICELCTDAEIIYPFQLGTTHTCGQCYGVYHAACARGRDCPRCARRRARHNQPAHA